MSVSLLLLLLAGPLLLTVLAFVAQSVTRGRVDTRQEWRWVRATVAAAVAVGVLSALLLNAVLDLGRGAMLTPAVLGLFVVAGVGLGEAVVRPPRPSGLRTASLASRRVSDYVPPSVTAAAVGLAILHVATLVLTTVTASSDDLGRTGRQVAAQCGLTGSAAGPYPGIFYSAPLAALLMAIVLAAAAALTVVVRRPRGFAPDDVTDDVLRRRSATRVVAAAGAAVAASHAGIAFFAATALLRMDCQEAWMDPVGWLLMASVPVAVVLLGWFLGRVITPGAVPPVEAEQAVGSR